MGGTDALQCISMKVSAITKNTFSLTDVTPLPITIEINPSQLKRQIHQ